jgi:hypothetical protein
MVLVDAVHEDQVPLFRLEVWGAVMIAALAKPSVLVK